MKEENSTTSCRLAEASPGCYRCVHLDSSATAMRRLQQLGFCENREMEVVACGNPLVVRVDRTEIGVSKQLAEMILVAN